jgi:hypothetical protein
MHGEMTEVRTTVTEERVTATTQPATTQPDEVTK